MKTHTAIRREARRTAAEARAALRDERVARERRLADLAVDVLSALGERDMAVVDGERTAGEAIRTMTTEEGLSLREAMDWLGQRVSLAEAGRLRRLATTPRTPTDDLPAQG